MGSRSRWAQAIPLVASGRRDAVLLGCPMPQWRQHASCQALVCLVCFISRQLPPHRVGGAPLIQRGAALPRQDLAEVEVGDCPMGEGEV